MTSDSLSAWDWQHRHDLDGITGENAEMLMILKKLGGGLVRVCAYHCKCAHLIVRVVDTLLTNFLGFS